MRFFEALIIVPAVYLALHQVALARPITLLSLGRKRGCTLANAMEGDRYIRRQKLQDAPIVRFGAWTPDAK